MGWSAEPSYLVSKARHPLMLANRQSELSTMIEVIRRQPGQWQRQPLIISAGAVGAGNQDQHRFGWFRSHKFLSLRSVRTMTASVMAPFRQRRKRSLVTNGVRSFFLQGLIRLVNQNSKGLPECPFDAVRTGNFQI